MTIAWYTGSNPVPQRKCHSSPSSVYVANNRLPWKKQSIIYLQRTLIRFPPLRKRSILNLTQTERTLYRPMSRDSIYRRDRVHAWVAPSVYIYIYICTMGWSHLYGLPREDRFKPDRHMHADIYHIIANSDNEVES